MGDREHCAAVLPQARLQPAHGLIIQVIGRLIELDLPAPLSPMMPAFSPGLTLKDTASSTTRSS
ncbi:hypothetical protein [Micromonospora sp. WMMD812]|uniref:hypothetical protein n=1 Tax=Micromonospora sp. WMMD812 TaxID=3015152 RepID=UPI00248AF99C|nr:hypothetical protein [Micromonospora sp. WMMD812]WBB70755.1 hypothetical protein O7603_15950 [Micromonospora sp. WMMD812]